MKNKLTFAFSLFFLVTLAGGSAMATEEPQFTTSLKEGAFEVRSYPALVAAQVSVTGTQDEAARAGFKLLAAYIFGGNTQRQSIAMTAPVIQSATPGGAEGWTVRFIMPSEFTLDTLPTPNNAQVQLLELPPARYAVVTFSGLANEGDVAKRTAELTTFIGHNGLRASGPPALARYNPPWTLWFMRRNEVQIPLAP